MKRVVVLLVSIGLLVASLGSVAAAPEPLRSGTIEGGNGVVTGGGPPWENPAIQRSGCEYAAECLAWLDSGCNPALAGHDPALTASIVDVGDLADGRTRRTFHTVAPHVPPWGLYPGAVIQLWRQDCTEIPDAKRHTIGSSSRCDWNPYPSVRCEPFPIPTGTKWMTVSGYATTVHMSWSLT